MNSIEEAGVELPDISEEEEIPKITEIDELLFLRSPKSLLIQQRQFNDIFL